MTIESPRISVAFAADGIEAGAFSPSRFRAVERVGEPHVIDLTVDMPRETEVDARGLLGKMAELRILDVQNESLARLFWGVLTRVREPVGRIDSSDGFGRRKELHLRLESPLALLRMSSDYRIFQELDTVGIVKAVLAQAGLSDVAVFRFSDAYDVFTSRTMLGESIFSFVQRLLEEAGIFSFARALEPKIVFGDGPEDWEDIPGGLSVPYRSSGGLRGAWAIDDFAPRRRSTPGKVTFRDHAHAKPSLLVEGKSERAQHPFASEHYEYPTGHAASTAIQKQVQARAERQRDAYAAADRQYSGRSTLPPLAAGHVFTLEGAPDDALNDTYVALEVHHLWSRPVEGSEQSGRYTNEFVAIRKSLPYRPLVTTPRRRAPGPMIATVTGPAGEEVHVDASGRVKVQFPWDRRGKNDETSSAWVAIAQPMFSGPMLLPRIGWEVLVDFEDGDPDQPVVIGRLFNGLHVPPFTLPTNHGIAAFGTFVSPGGNGFNSLRLEDPAGSEQIRLIAQKDLQWDVAKDRKEVVGKADNLAITADQQAEIGGNESVDVKTDEDIQIGGTRTIKVKKSRAIELKAESATNIGGSRTTAIGKDHTMSIAKSLRVDVGVDAKDDVDGNRSDSSTKEFELTVAGDTKLHVDGTFSDATDDGRSVQLLGDHKTTITGALEESSDGEFRIGVGGDETTKVGAALSMESGAVLQLSSDGTLTIDAGPTLTALGQTAIVLKVGSSTVTLAAGGVVMKSTNIKWTSSGPAAFTGIILDN